MKVIKFSKIFMPAAIASTAIILFGVAGIFIRGINLGVDFRAGLKESIRLALPALSVTYEGEGNAKLTFNERGAVLVVSGKMEGDLTKEIPYAQAKTLAEMSTALMAVPGVKAQVSGDASIASTEILPTAQADTVLNAAATIVHRAVKESEAFATIADVRAAADSVGSAAVQIVGKKADLTFMIQIQDNGKNPDFSKTVTASLGTALKEKFGAERLMVLRTDFVGARFSKNLGAISAMLVLVALGAILVYAIIRFKLQYAIGAVLAIVHDALVMVAFIVWTGMEFNTSTIAAILTILGFSINDTIVIFDRIREDRGLRPDMPFVPLLDSALTETLSRTIITTLTTLICVITLFVATKDIMRDFALALVVGMVSGTYSTIYIATAFVALWQDVSDKRKRSAKPKAAEPHLKPLKA